MERELDKDSITETHAVMFRALANSSRLKIIGLLSQHEELCVCDMMVALGQAQSLTSYHLAVLEDTGLVTHREEGTWSYYKLNEERLRGLLSPQYYSSLLKQEEVFA